jgi:hypothetical protein
MHVALAIGVDLTHLVAMLGWGLGLPLLVWHRWPRATVAYTWYALTFIVVSQLSHMILGECFLTTLSRLLWQATGDSSEASFSVRLVNAVAGIRPSEQSVVILWKIAIFATSIGILWSLRRRRERHTEQAACTR